MGEYRLPIRLLIAGAVMLGMGVYGLLEPPIEGVPEVRNIIFALLIAGVLALVTGGVLWPRSKKKPDVPPGDEQSSPHSTE
jgi:hypothetical protein